MTGERPKWNSSPRTGSPTVGAVRPKLIHHGDSLVSDSSSGDEPFGVQPVVVCEKVPSPVPRTVRPGRVPTLDIHGSRSRSASRLREIAGRLDYASNGDESPRDRSPRPVALIPVVNGESVTETSGMSGMSRVYGGSPGGVLEASIVSGHRHPYQHRSEGAVSPLASVSPVAVSPVTPRRPYVRVEAAAGAHALLGLVHQVQSRLVAKAFRTILLQPVSVRTDAINNKLRTLEKTAAMLKGVLKLVTLVTASPTYFGRSEFFHRLKIVNMAATGHSVAMTRTSRDLRRLMGMQLLTSVADKVQSMHIAWSFFQLYKLPTPVMEFNN